MDKKMKNASNKNIKDFVNSPQIKAMLEAFVRMENSKNYEFVTSENGYTYNVGYKTEEENKIYFVVKISEKNKDKEVKQITEKDYADICKGKSLVISFFSN